MKNNIKFYNLRTNTKFKIYGFNWLTENDSFIRLPIEDLQSIKEYNPGVFLHAQDTAGGQLHFITDSTQLVIKVRLSKQNSITWMSDVGQGGFDCYLGDDYHNLKFISTSKFLKSHTKYESILFKDLPKQRRLVVLNFPLYNGVSDLEIGFDVDANLLEPADLPTEKIVVYGTSIVQGGCVNRPGLAYSNILSRKLTKEVINLGFSGSAFGEEAMAGIIASIKDVCLFIIDYEANAGEKNTYEQTLERFIQIIRSAQPQALILICSQIAFNREQFCQNSKHQREERLKFQKNLFNRLRKTDDKLLFLDCSKIFAKNYTEYTVDGVHPNDIGMEILSQAIYQKIKSYF